MSVKLTMLGTGYATAMRCYNTCFLLQSADTLLMVDAGGGNGVLNQLERVGVPLEKIHHLCPVNFLFICHLLFHLF